MCEKMYPYNHLISYEELWLIGIKIPDYRYRYLYICFDTVVVLLITSLMSKIYIFILILKIFHIKVVAVYNSSITIDIKLLATVGNFDFFGTDQIRRKIDYLATYSLLDIKIAIFAIS